MRLGTSIPLILVLALSSQLGSETYSRDLSSATHSKALKKSINGPTELAYDRSGSLFIVESLERRVLRLDIHDGSVEVVFSSPRRQNLFPNSVATNADGDLYIADIDGRIRRLHTHAEGIEPIFDAPPGDGKAAVSWPTQIAVDPEGNLLVADQHRNTLIRLRADGSNPEAVAGTGARGFSGDGESAKEARLDGLSGVAVDRNGTIFIADRGNCRIRKVDKDSQEITTIAGTGECKSGKDGISAIHAAIDYPGSMATDSRDNLYFIEGGRVRKIDTAGIISTFAGTGEAGFSGDGGPATKARLNNPAGIAIDSDGNVYIAEFVSNRIRRVDAKTNTISTVAGNGKPKRVDIML